MNKQLTAQQIFEDLACEYGSYGKKGKYVLVSDPYINNDGTSGDVIFEAYAATLELIEELQKEGFTHNGGCPDAEECFKIVWTPYKEWIESGDLDDSNACDWDSFDVYHYGEFIESVSS